MVTIFNDLKCFPVQNTSDVPLKSVRQVSAVRQNQPRHTPLMKTGCVRLAACQRWGQAAWQAWAAAILTKPMYTQQEIESVNSIWFGVTNPYHQSFHIFWTQAVKEMRDKTSVHNETCPSSFFRFFFFLSAISCWQARIASAFLKDIADRSPGSYQAKDGCRICFLGQASFWSVISGHMKYLSTTINLESSLFAFIHAVIHPSIGSWTHWHIHSFMHSFIQFISLHFISFHVSFV